MQQQEVFSVKEAYLNAEMDVVWFAELDIIRCSDFLMPEDDPTVPTTTFVPANNEGPPAYDAWD